MAAHEKDEKDHTSTFEYPLSSKGYVILAEIGRGAFARVYRAKCATDHTRDVAIKIMNLEKHDGIFQFIRNEIGIMSKVKHPNLVEMYCSFVEGTSLWVVMPLHRGGSCCHIMKTLEPFGFKDEAVVATIIREALKGLRYLHSGGHIHRDIKADNILMSESGEIQLCDFGVAGALIQNGSRGKAVNVVGTPCWMAPEVVDHADGYDDRADIWSLGITAMELAFGMAPYEDKTRDAVMKKIVEDEPPTPNTAYAHLPGRQHKVSKELCDFVAQCLQKDATKRPTAATLSTHKWLSKRAQDCKYIVENVVSRLPKEYLGASTSQINTVNMSYYRIPIRESTGRPPNPDSVVHRDRQESWDFTVAPQEKEDKKGMSLKELQAWGDKPRTVSSAEGFDHAGSRIESKGDVEDFPSTASEILVRNVFEEDDDDRARGSGAREVSTTPKDNSVLIEGYLAKKSPKNVFSRHVWQKRWFTVRVDRRKRHITLLYFKQERKGEVTEAMALGHIPLEEVRQVTIASGKPGRFNLAIRSRTRGSQRLLELRSESLMEAQRWTTTLSKYIKAIWDDRRGMKAKHRKVVLHSEVAEVLRLLKAGTTFFKYNEQPSSKAGQESQTEKLVVEVYWKEDEHSKGGKLFAAEPRDRERASMLRLGAAPTSAPTASVISPTLITTSTSLPLSVDALPIESITEILIGKNTNALLNPIASSAPDVCCVSVLGHTQWNLQADSQEHLQAFLFGIETLVKKCGKKIIRSETETSVLRVIDRRHMSMPVDVSNLDLGATVSDLKRGRMEEYALVALENKFTNKIRLVHPGRVLVRQGPLTLKKSFNESKYEFFLFNDLLLYANYVNYRFKLKKNFPIGREFQVVDLQDDPKRKNQFWIVAAEKTLLIQAANATEKQAWLNDLTRCLHHQIVPKARREEKQHQDLEARQREQDLHSLRMREQRKQIDQSAFSSVTEVPKVQPAKGSSLRDLNIPERAPGEQAPPHPGHHGSHGGHGGHGGHGHGHGHHAHHPSSPPQSSPLQSSPPQSSPPTSQPQSAQPLTSVSSKPSSPTHSPKASTAKKSSSTPPTSTPSSALPSPTTVSSSFNFTVDTSTTGASPSKPLASPKSGVRPLSVNSSPEKSPVHSPTSQGGSSTFPGLAPKDIHEWLGWMGSAFVQYGKTLEDNGLSLDFILSGKEFSDSELALAGVANPLHRKRIMFAIDSERQRREAQLKREHDEESPASETEDDPTQIQSHVPVLTLEEDGLDHHESDLLTSNLPSSGSSSPGTTSSTTSSSSSTSSGTNPTPPPPPDPVELPPPPPEDGGRVYPPPPG